MSIRGLDAVSGQPIFIKSSSGSGTQEDPYVMERADPIAHAKLDQVKASVDAINTVWLHHSNFGNAATGIAKNTAGRLRSFVLANEGLTTCYLLFFNSSSVPANGANTLAFPPFPVYAGTTFAVGQSELGAGFSFTTGISYGISSTRDIYTAIAVPSDIRLLMGYQ